MIEGHRDISALWFLTRARFSQGWRKLTSDARVFIGVLIFVIAMLLMAFANYRVFVLVFQTMGDSAAEPILALPLLMGFILSLFVGLGYANDILYLSADLELLLSLPLNDRWVMLTKIAWVWPIVLAVQVVVAMPSCLAYAVVLGWWPVLAIYLLAVPVTSLVTAALSTIALVLAGRVATSARLRESLGLLGAAAGAALYIGFLSMQSRVSMETVGEGLLRISDTAAPIWSGPLTLPLTWPAECLRLMNAGQMLTGWIAVLVAVALALGLTALLAFSGAMLYRMNLTITRRGRPHRQSGGGRFLKVPARWAQMVALLMRDWIILTRNPRLWQGVIFPAAVFGFFFVQTWMRLPDIFSPLIWGCIAAGVAGVLAASQLAPMSFAGEYASFYHLGTLPISSRLRVLSKLVVFAAPPALFAAVLSAVAIRTTGSPGDLIMAWMLVTAASLSGTAVGIQSAADSTNFGRNNPVEAQSVRGGCLQFACIFFIMLFSYAMLRQLIAVAERVVGLQQTAAEAIASVVISAVLIFVFVPAMIARASRVLQRRAAEAPSSGAGGYR